MAVEKDEAEGKSAHRLLISRLRAKNLNKSITLVKIWKDTQSQKML